jgi:hypothetical protein
MNICWQTRVIKEAKVWWLADIAYHADVLAYNIK